MPEPALSAVADLIAERDRLAHHVAILNGKLIDVTSQLTAITGGDPDAVYREVVRKAYRRGYLAGRGAQRRGAPAVTNPERHARTWVREAIHG